jgi:hypothetical protein
MVAQGGGFKGRLTFVIVQEREVVKGRLTDGSSGWRSSPGGEEKR